ncbi:TetR/AcrR family transcriptional regulator [Leifsonia sp. fls2-241-R2A-40a]|uniref:TetR/AcrR family transcriptional regulator n=1 Tax=Leifsonia sp. fls2-241-R2A-40a TaxID=3040290 RepID=UPI00254B77CD|nr:TetR/AcrR family transcriptional regulator [Leifsonia sp. fls2-241-R2A-40a]
MGRTSDARERILAAGADLFGRRSYASIGVAEICGAAGVPKGSFYYFFPSKQALALEVVNQHWQWQRGEWLRILSTSAPIVGRLHDLFVATAEMQSQALKGTGAVVGCLFGNLALELSAEDDPVQQRLREIFEEQIDIVESALRDAAAAGELEPSDLRESAKAIVAQIEGLVLLAKLYNDPGQLDSLWRNSMRLLGLGDATAGAAAQ